MSRTIVLRSDRRKIIDEYRNFAEEDGIEVLFDSRGERWYEKYPTKSLKIILYLQQQSDKREVIPQNELSRELNFSKYTVSYHIEKLQKDHVVKRGGPLINRSKGIRLLKRIPEEEFPILETIILE